MNLEDVKEYITQKKETTFGTVLPIANEIEQELFSKFGSDLLTVNTDEVEEYLRQKAPHRKYGLRGITHNSQEILRYRVVDRYVKGWFYKLVYRGITFVGHAHKDGEIESINHTFNIYDRDQFVRTNWHKMEVCDTLEELYNDFLKEVKKSKRKTMNHYNKLIKDVKQSYKRELKRHNDILKGDSK